MSDATAAPLRPVSRSSVVTLWLGLLALIVGAGAWAMTLSRVEGIELTTVRAGTGAFPTDSDVAIIKYEGRLADGTVFDAGDGVPLPVGRMVPGFAQGLKRMQVGGKYELEIPSELGYGAQGAGPIPANSDIAFTVELLDVKSEAEMQQIMMQQQMMQQMQQQGAGDPGGAAPPPQ